MLGARFDYDGKPILVEKQFNMKKKAEVDRKIKEGIYQFESIPCVVCGGDNFETLSRKDHHGLFSSVVICKQCGLIQTNPRMTEESLFRYYQEDYREMYGDEVQVEFVAEYNAGKSITAYMRQIIDFERRSQLRVLEVGCASGGILKYFKDIGCTVAGVDIGKEWVENGKRKYGLDLSVGTIFDVEGKFDVIIYSDTFEHIAHPKKELTQIRKVLSKNGLLYLGVPSPKNLLHTYDMDFLQYVHFEHTYHFTLTTLRNLLETNGFKFLLGNGHVQSVFTKSSDSSKEIVNDYHAMITFLKLLEKFRSKLYRPFPHRLYWYVPYPKFKIKRLPVVFVKKSLIMLGCQLDTIRNIC